MSEAPQPIPFIDPQSLRDLVRSGEKVVIVDVRSREEFAASRVEGAVNIPSDQLVAQASELPADASIVTVCNSGRSRSCNAAEQLRRLGYDKAAVLRGGTHGWLKGRNDLPVRSTEARRLGRTMRVNCALPA